MIFRSTAIAHIQKGKSAIAHKGSNGGAIASYGYSYDAANRINRMTTPDGATTYRYDLSVVNSRIPCIAKVYRIFRQKEEPFYGSFSSQKPHSTVQYWQFWNSQREFLRA
jgi:hypothetical protein